MILTEMKGKYIFSYCFVNIVDHSVFQFLSNLVVKICKDL